MIIIHVEVQVNTLSNNAALFFWHRSERGVQGINCPRHANPLMLSPPTIKSKGRECFSREIQGGWTEYSPNPPLRTILELW
jgi:hypothetical protein